MSAYHGHRKLSLEMQRLIELNLGLKKGVLNKDQVERKPAYILINVIGNLAEEVLNDLKKVEIIDEVSLIRGDAAIFARVYGTEEEIDNFLLGDLYTSTSEKISGTTTLTTLKDKIFEKYPVRRHQDRKTNPNIWYE